MPDAPLQQAGGCEAPTRFKLHPITIVLTLLALAAMLGLVRRHPYSTISSAAGYQFGRFAVAVIFALIVGWVCFWLGGRSNLVGNLLFGAVLGLALASSANRRTQTSNAAVFDQLQQQHDAAVVPLQENIDAKAT